MEHATDERAAVEQTVEQPDAPLEERTERRGVDRETFLARVRGTRGDKPHGSYLANFPPLEETAKKIASLSAEDRSLLADSTRLDWGRTRKERADADGVTPAAIGLRLRKVLEALGIGRQQKLKKYVRRSISEYERKRPYYDSLAQPAQSAPEGEVTERIQNGHDHDAAPQLPAVSPPASAPIAVVRGDEAGAFLVKAPPGAKRITITIDL